MDLSTESILNGPLASGSGLGVGYTEPQEPLTTRLRRDYYSSTTMRDHLRKEKRRFENEYSMLRYPRTKVSDYQIITTLGTGSFGFVSLVCRASTKKRKTSSNGPRRVSSTLLHVPEGGMSSNSISLSGYGNRSWSSLCSAGSDMNLDKDGHLNINNDASASSVLSFADLEDAHHHSHPNILNNLYTLTTDHHHKSRAVAGGIALAAKSNGRDPSAFLVTVPPELNATTVANALSESGSNVLLNGCTSSHTLGSSTVHNPDIKYYALKTLRKENLELLKQTEHTINEKHILQCLDFPFIVSLYDAFQTNSYVHMVLEYVVGGELFLHLRRAGKFPEEYARFYAQEITLAFEYLHELSIAYRDLKPENILISQSGHVKLTDFGFAKVVKTRTWTLCGTPEYLAPEIILSWGYTKAVDWWALGILIFEMVAGCPPFYADQPFHVYKAIVEGKVVYPTYFSKELKNLISNFLQNDINKRLGNAKRGVDDIKSHSFFRKTNWDKVFRQETQPPLLPYFAHKGDTCNFEKYDDPIIQESDRMEYANEFSSF